MLKYLEKYRTLIAIILASILLAISLFLPVHMQAASIVTLLISIGMATVLIFQEHQRAYQDAECTREKMTRNLSFDLISLLLSMAAAIFAGGMAGRWAGMQAGLWVGLLAGFMGGFVAAWVVRFVWGKVAALA